jgi:hypothetical protein
MDSSANEREGYVMKEYNMEASTERSAGRKQAQPVAHRKSSGVSEGFGNVRRKQQERRLSISDRYVDRLEFSKIPKEGRELLV